MDGRFGFGLGVVRKMVLRTRLRCAPRILGRPAWFDETLGCRAYRHRGGGSGVDWLSGAGWYGSVKLVGDSVGSSNVCFVQCLLSILVSEGGRCEPLVVLSVLLSRPRALDARLFASPFTCPYTLPISHSRPLLSRVPKSPRSRIHVRVPLSLVRGQTVASIVKDRNREPRVAVWVSLAPVDASGPSERVSPDLCSWAGNSLLL